MRNISPQHALTFVVGLVAGGAFAALLTSVPDKLDTWRQATTFALPTSFFWFLLSAAILVCALLALVLGAARLKELTASFRGKDKRTGGEREELRRQATALGSLAAGHRERTQASIAFLQQTDKELSSSEGLDDLKRVVAALQAENTRNLEYTSQLERDLRVAQQRAASLQLKLTLAEELASLDPLTSIANRRRFDQFLARAVDDSHSDKTPLSVIFGDLDRFKLINDIHGHEAGDEALKLFARTITKCIRATDLAARYGGEEFAVILPRTPLGNGYDIAERIRMKFEAEAPLFLSGVSQLSASFGVAEVREGEGPSELVKRADEMLYAAKQAGRNRTKVSGSSDLANS